MSLFLAPIHFTMYEKIKNQDKINKKVLDEFDNYDIKSQVEKETGFLSDEKLEDIIDQKNIHGWLQSKIDVVESGFSMIVEELMNKGLKKEELLDFFKAEGKKIDNLNTAEEIFRKFTDTFLDGMPCDRAIMPVEISDEKVKWVQNVDVHGKFWPDEGEMYNEIREAWISGLAEANGFNFKIENGEYEVFK